MEEKYIEYMKSQIQEVKDWEFEELEAIKNYEEDPEAGRFGKIDRDLEVDNIDREYRSRMLSILERAIDRGVNKEDLTKIFGDETMGNIYWDDLMEG